MFGSLRARVCSDPARVYGSGYRRAVNADRPIGFAGSFCLECGPSHEDDGLRGNSIGNPGLPGLLPIRPQTIFLLGPLKRWKHTE